MATEQSFAAIDTFDAAFGKTYFPFFGGGVQVVIRRRFFVEVSASRFRQTGAARLPQRRQGVQARHSADRDDHAARDHRRLSVPPAQLPRVRPYAAAGVGRTPTRRLSDSPSRRRDVDTRHAGFVVNGGAEFRLHRWVGLAVDVQYTHVPGILGTGGVSQQAGESDLGGVAARFKLVVGR